MEEALKHWRDGEDVWIYGYGSLIWRPEFEYQERRLATLHGYHRALCLWSRVNRGTPECPGLVFGLDRGGSCRGVVYRLDGATVPRFFPLLWGREMSTGSYLPRWLSCVTEEGPVKALVFVMNRASPAYISALPEPELLAIIRRASGRYGPCIDYVVQTAQALHAAGIRDRRLSHVARLLVEQRHTLPEG
jgi:cation transport protein ChaC